MIKLWISGFALLITGCSTTLNTKYQTLIGGNTQPTSTPSLAIKDQTNVSSPSVSSNVIPGNKTSLKQTHLANQSIIKQGATLAFNNTPITEVAQTLLTDVLGEPVIVNDSIEGVMTLKSSKPLAKSQILPILEAALAAKGIILIRGVNGYELQNKTNALNAVNPRLQTQAGYGVEVIQTEYISSKVLLDILKPLAKNGVLLSQDHLNNTLVLSGNSIDRQRWRDTARLFDVDKLRNRSVGIYTLKYQAPEDIIKQLSTILIEDEKDQRLRLIPMHATQSVLAVATQSHYLEKISQWIERLDISVSKSNSRLFVYKVKNRDAEELVKVLDPVINTITEGVTPTVNTDISPLNQQASLKPAKKETIKVVADKEKNALLILATPEQRPVIEDALIELDTPPRQVIIEASIVDVKLTEELKYGLEWYFKNGINSNTGKGNLNFGTAIAENALGFSYSLVSSGGVVQALLNALAEENKINVVSSPSLMVLDNHTAEINVGDQQPIKTATNVTNNTTTENIELKDTGVQLKVTPSVNPGGLVTLNVEQTVTDVGAEDAVTGQRSFLRREVKSTVAVNNGQTIVLGGLISSKSENTASGIPELRRVPVFGALFSSESKSATRNELVILLTPRVVETPKDNNQLLQDYRNGLTLLSF